MHCEVCGREIYGQPYYRVIEGGKMTVCGQCAQFSKQEWDPRKPQARPIRRRPSGAPQIRRRSDIEVAESIEVVEKYGILIRKTRQKKGLTIEDFAKKLNEKESVIKKMEKEQLNPNMTLIRKIQNELGINLLDTSPATKGPVLSRPMGPRTLGDMIKIKTPKDEEEEE
ncbi:MAG: multiprotein bridging factor aMBF1 [Candidatus Bathyarchaeota archaeon]|nr:multiprotein bridging factor aMBF1 [Candidatus Bathyarchaeota archaeon]